MRTGVVDVSGEALTLYVFEHSPDGPARTIVHRTVALNLHRRGDDMVLVPGLIDLALETIRRFVIVARNAGCGLVHTSVDVGLTSAAIADEIVEHVRAAVAGTSETGVMTTISISDPRPEVAATPSPV